MAVNSLKFLKENLLMENNLLGQITIGQTCERYPRMECSDRVAVPVIYQQELELESQRKLISDLTH